MKDSFDELLKQPVPERKPLSQEEGKEAIITAWKLRDIAKAKIPEGKDFIMIVFEKTEDIHQRITLYSGKKIEMQKPRNPKTDLVIMVSEEKKNESGEMIPTRVVDKYFFADDEVTKTTFDLRGTKDVNFGRLNINIGADREGKFQDVNANFQMSDPSLINKQAERQINQRTEETYHPNAADLNNLLANLSSTKPL